MSQQEFTPKRDTDWMDEAKCWSKGSKNLDTFFPSDGDSLKPAQDICGTCPVKPDCLEFALRNGIDHGVWGGTSERERRRIARKRYIQSDKINRSNNI